jgi:hypothetical protein
MSAENQHPIQSPEPILAPGPLFVVSMWRSGSSLLYALLNKHPQVALMYEADLMLLKPAFHKPRGHRDWAERWEFWNGALSRHQIGTTDVMQASSDFRSAFTTAHQLYARQRGAAIWGDKSPNYYDRLNQTADDFPQARFIILWRDPHGTANAILRAASMNSSYFGRKGAALCGLLGYSVFKKECDRLVARGQAVCQISYEELISDAPRVMRRVCEFLEISYDESLCSLAGADRSAIYEGQHHANVKSDTIVSAPRKDLLSPGLRRKISQHVARWHQLHDGAWPPYPVAADDRVPPSSWLSRMMDGMKYRVFRATDRLSPVVFSFFPISWLRRYRQWKSRRRQAIPEELAKPDATGSSSAAGALAQGGRQ